MQSTQDLINLFEAGQIGKAWAGVKKALKKHPRDTVLLHLAGAIAFKKRDLRAAIKYLEQSIHAGNRRPACVNMLSGIYAETGAHSKLVKLEKVVGGAHLSADFSFKRAVALWKTGNIVEARNEIRALQKASPELSAEALNLKGVLASSDSDFHEAIASLEKAIATKPYVPDFRSNISRPLQMLEQFDEARKHLYAALEIDGAHELTLERIVALETAAGDFAAAKKWVEKLAKKYKSVSSAVAYLELYDGQEQSGIESHMISFGFPKKIVEAPEVKIAVSALERRAGNNKVSTKYLKTANQDLAKSRHYEAGWGKERGDHARSSWQELAGITAAGITESVAGPTPLFIIGVMRSGTTLLERMLGNGENVAGLGEIGILDRAFRHARDTNTRVDEIALGAIKQEYAALFAARADSAAWIVDKMPINMRYAGFLTRMWPNAKIIHLRRHPNDVATSIFETIFDSQAQNFSFTEAGIEEHFEEHLRQVAFWREQNVEMLTVDYEDLVRAPERELRRITEYCGMDFCEAMLRPEENAGTIQTASVLQARNAINSASIGRWRDRADLLPNLFERWAKGWHNVDSRPQNLK